MPAGRDSRLFGGDQKDPPFLVGTRLIRTLGGLEGFTGEIDFKQHTLLEIRRTIRHQEDKIILNFI